MIQLKGKDYCTGKNAKSNYMLFTRKQLEHNDTNFLKIKRMEKICNANTNEKKINVYTNIRQIIL